MIYKEPGVIQRYANNPIIAPKDIPYPCDRVYNAAACKAGSEYILILRIDNVSVPSFYKQCLGMARSKDGIHFTVEPEPVLVPSEDEYGNINDPRITFIDGWYYLAYCSDPGAEAGAYEGIYLCIAKTQDFKHWERIYKSQPDNRNAVIFPEKINGLYARLDRPFRRGYRKENGYDIWISYSPDMIFWGKHHLVLSHLDVPWGSHKIGPAAPPIKTDKGWLTLFHGAEIVEPDNYFLEWGKAAYSGGITKVYRPGIMLLDLHDPSKILGIRQEPLMEITADYEKDTSYRPNAIFPTGIIDEGDGTVKIYYGASDTTIAMGTAKIDELVALCLE